MTSKDTFGSLLAGLVGGSFAVGLIVSIGLLTMPDEIKTRPTLAWATDTTYVVDRKVSWLSTGWFNSRADERWHCDTTINILQIVTRRVVIPPTTVDTTVAWRVEGQ